MNVLRDLAQVLTPAPPYTSWEYEGVQYRWKNLVFRPACLYSSTLHYYCWQLIFFHRLLVFKNEVFLLAGLALYIVWYIIGKSINRKRAETWLVFIILAPAVT